VSHKVDLVSKIKEMFSFRSMESLNSEELELRNFLEKCGSKQTSFFSKSPHEKQMQLKTCGGIQIPRSFLLFDSVLAVSSQMKAGQIFVFFVDSTLEFNISKTMSSEVMFHSVSCCSDKITSTCSSCEAALDRISLISQPTEKRAALIKTAVETNNQILSERLARETEDLESIQSFEVCCPNVKARMDHMWGLFSSNDDILSSAIFPHNHHHSLATKPFLTISAKVGHKNVGFFYDHSNWQELTSNISSLMSRRLTTKWKERKWMSTRWVELLPFLVMWGLPLTNRRHVHFLDPVFYMQMSNPLASGSPRMERQTWSAKVVNQVFESTIGKNMKCAQSYAFLLDPDAVVHIQIYCESHFSSVSLFNITRCLNLPDSNQSHTNPGCRLGIDNLKTHDLRTFADNIAL